MKCMNRRNFLTCSAAAAAMVMMPWEITSAQRLMAVALGQEENYYLTNQQTLIQEFGGVLAGAKEFLTPELGKEPTEQIAQQAMERFQVMLTNLPDVGGEKNWDTQFIPTAAWYIALYEPMKGYGKKPEDIGKLIYDLNQYMIQGTPAQELLAQGEAIFAPAGQKDLQQWAKWTQLRQLPDNWVAEYIPAQEGEFDYGIDYHECALVKLFQREGLPELAPYVCLNDFLRSKAQGTGLIRTKTIAGGDGICNFRYKKGREVTQDWSTEIGRIQKRPSV